MERSLYGLLALLIAGGQQPSLSSRGRLLAAHTLKSTPQGAAVLLLHAGSSQPTDTGLAHLAHLRGRGGEV